MRSFIGQRTGPVCAVLWLFLFAMGDSALAWDEQHSEGDCLDCHENHGKPGDCTACHEMAREDLGGHSPLVPTFPQPHDTPRQGDIDGITGASGDYYYGAASYLNAAYLMSRINRIHGGAKLFSTVNRVKSDETGEWRYTPNIATFGYGMREEGGKYYVFLDIGKNNSCYNAIRSGDIRFSYYEYQPEQEEKFVRNRGARIIGRVDYGRTALKSPDWRTELPGFGTGERFTPEAVDWEKVGACSLVAEIVGIIPLG